MKFSKNSPDGGRLPGLVFISLLILATAPILTPAIADTVQETSAAETQNARALELYDAGKYEEAIKAYQEAIKLKKDYAEAHYNLGDAYFKLSQYKKAIEAYKQAIRYQPGQPTAYNNMGSAHYKLGEHNKAVEAYKRSILLDPKSSITYFNLGATYLGRGNREAALVQYEILKTIDAQVASQLHALIFKPIATVFDSRGPNSVRLNVTATDAQGRLLSDLKQENFQVLEDGLPQPISLFSKETFPVVYGLTIDTSGSFAKALQLGIDVAKAIIQSCSDADEGQLVRFVDSDKIETIEGFTSDKEALIDGLDTLFVEGGQSAILDAVYLSAQGVAAYKPTNGSYLRRVVILITDGDERVSYYDLDHVLKLLHKIDVQVFAISIDKESNKNSKLNRNPQERATNLLTRLARETGGYAFFPKSVSELQALPNEITKILRAQYLIGYKPSQSGPGDSRRRVTVKLVNLPDGDGSKVITRTGYTISEK